MDKKRALLNNKRELVKRYGSNAEKVMYKILNQDSPSLDESIFNRNNQDIYNKEHRRKYLELLDSYKKIDDPKMKEKVKPSLVKIAKKLNIKLDL